QEAVALGVVEVRPLPPLPLAVEADRLQQTYELRVDRASVQLELLAAVLLDQLADAERRHAAESTAAAPGAARGCPLPAVERGPRAPSVRCDGDARRQTSAGSCSSSSAP